MLDFLVAILIIVLLIALPTIGYLAIAQYKVGQHVGEWWFKRNHTFPDQPSSDDTRKITLKKKG